MLRAVAGVAFCVALTIARPRVAGATDPFEIQVYDGTANRPGEVGAELHVNDWATGQRRSSPPELPLHGQAHLTLEPSVGVLPFWELGGYLQTALRDDGTFDWAGVKLRSKFVTPPGWQSTRWRLGLNLEVAYLPPAYDRDRWGLELRPILGWENEDWIFAFNPIVDQSLAGSGASEGPSFEPALKAARRVSVVALGFEYYGTFGPIAAPLPLRDQQHTLYGAFDLLSSDRFELNAAVGAGLTPASEGIVFKAILGYTFERSATRPPSWASNTRPQ